MSTKDRPSGAFSHLRNMRHLCKPYTQTGACDVADCPFSHHQCQEARVPTDKCKFDPCKITRCEYFHGTMLEWERLQLWVESTTPVPTVYRPRDYLELKDPREELEKHPAESGKELVERMKRDLAARGGGPAVAQHIGGGSGGGMPPGTAMAILNLPGGGGPFRLDAQSPAFVPTGATSPPPPAGAFSAGNSSPRQRGSAPAPPLPAGSPSRQRPISSSGQQGGGGISPTHALLAGRSPRKQQPHAAQPQQPTANAMMQPQAQAQAQPQPQSRPDQPLALTTPNISLLKTTKGEVIAWFCPQCHNQNELLAVECVVCELEKPWTCGLCHVANFGSRKTCAGCKVATRPVLPRGAAVSPSTFRLSGSHYMGSSRESSAGTNHHGPQPLLGLPTDSQAPRRGSLGHWEVTSGSGGHGSSTVSSALVCDLQTPPHVTAMDLSSPFHFAPDSPFNSPPLTQQNTRHTEQRTRDHSGESEGVSEGVSEGCDGGTLHNVYQ